MNIFYGSAIQGLPNRGERVETNTAIIKAMISMGHTVLAEHTTGRTSEEVAQLLEAALGPLPPKGSERTAFVRKKMIETIERTDLDLIVFEVSVPSTGTGIELAHAYLRPRLGLSAVPILILYERDYWPNGLSSMVKGLPLDEAPSMQLVEYTNANDLAAVVRDFILKQAA